MAEIKLPTTKLVIFVLGYFKLIKYFYFINTDLFFCNQEWVKSCVGCCTQAHKIAVSIPGLFAAVCSWAKFFVSCCLGSLSCEGGAAMSLHPFLGEMLWFLKLDRWYGVPGVKGLVMSEGLLIRLLSCWSSAFNVSVKRISTIVCLFVCFLIMIF